MAGAQSKGSRTPRPHWRLDASKPIQVPGARQAGRQAAGTRVPEGALTGLSAPPPPRTPSCVSAVEERIQVRTQDP